MPTIHKRSELRTELGVPDDSFPITPSDTVDLAVPVRAIRATGAGNVVAVMQNGQQRTLAFAPGETRYLKVKRVLATSTTATGLEGMP